MKRILVSVILALISLGAFAAGNKWENLFNGKDLAGWKRVNGTAAYTVVKGEIVGTTQINTSNTFLTTPLTFADFLLEYEIKMDEGLNSGVLIQSESNKEYNDGRVLGCQVICDDSPRA